MGECCILNGRFQLEISDCLHEYITTQVWAVIGVEGVAVVFLLVLLVGSIVLMSRKRIVAEGPEDSGGDFL